MDVVSSAAAVVQLLAQVIDLWQQIDTARDSVKTAPKVFDDTKAHASNLRDIIREVECRPELHTAAIHAQIQQVEVVASELDQILKAMAQRQRKSALRQGLRALGRAARDEAKLDDVLKRLERAKADLMLRISVVHVGMSGEMAEIMGKSIKGAEAVADDRTKTRETDHHLFVEGNECAREQSTEESHNGRALFP
ncbi:hypothetical protein DL770_001416 [Monosporascus sp. CRB-9-2]|nr:hypothetical protein DL770_001416 [Monosporascus sp. CRB-9-2]